MLICPDKNCTKCKRLAEFREINKLKYPNYHNGSVTSFGALNSNILIVGLAPGLNGANQTSRPFTGDYAGDVLYPTIKKFGFADGEYGKNIHDGFKLKNVRITNAVRCVPPQNKVTADEVTNCRKFLISEIENMPNLKIIVALGSVSHEAVSKALGYPKSAFKFTHNASHNLYKHNLTLIDSYHTSRYNINTGVLTQKMFEDVIKNMSSLV
jgi:uracil-DNA glycosylase family 4